MKLFILAGAFAFLADISSCMRASKLDSTNHHNSVNLRPVHQGWTDYLPSEVNDALGRANKVLDENTGGDLLKDIGNGFANLSGDEWKNMFTKDRKWHQKLK